MSITKTLEQKYPSTCNTNHTISSYGTLLVEEHDSETDRMTSRNTIANPTTLIVLIKIVPTS